MIADIQSQRTVEAERIYATGASKGGMFTLRLGCERPGLIRAVAPVIANFPADVVDTCQPGHPVPIAFFHGTEDQLMPYDGGMIGGESGADEERGETISAPETVEWWAINNGCQPTPEAQMLADRARYDGTRVELLNYTDCQNDASVLQYRINGGGHTWPGSLVPPLTPEAGITSKDINATMEIWRFFEPL